MTKNPEVAALEQRIRELDDEKQRLIVHIGELRREAPPAAELRGQPVALRAPSTPEEKVVLFLSLFRAREDLFPKLWENVRKGTKGYSPACRNEWVPGVCSKPRTRCSVCPEQSFQALDEAAVEDHLRGGCTIGTYAIRKDDTCVFLACDFDGSGWQEDAKAYQRAGAELGVDVALERSRSGNGAHVWVFFSEPVAAELARRLGTLLLARALDSRPEISFRSYDRFFPSQDYLPKGGFGNLIALPLQKLPREKGNSVFLDSQFEPVQDQWGYLACIHRLSADNVRSILRDHADLGTEPDSSQFPDATIRADERLLAVRDSDGGQQIAGRAVSIQLDAGLSISREGLPPKLVGRLKRLAAFPNPEFYKLNRMRLPTYPHPRIVFSGELQADRLVLPRGVLDDAIRVLRGAGALVTVQDCRPRPRGIRVEFCGQLMTEQHKAVRALKPHDFGVLVAPPGSGKTVVACALIARRKSPTLVLVHRQQLVEQWRSRLREFLDLTEEEVGVVAGTKKEPTGRVDIAMIQTLSRAADLDDILPHYGLLVVDECHHIPARSFELVLKILGARFVLGLTATPYRKDGLQRMIHLYCGPTRYETQTADGGALAKRVVVRETGFRMPESAGFAAPIHVVWHYLTRDSIRNARIAEDIASAMLQGRVPLVLSDRKEHLKLLGDEVAARVGEEAARIFRLDGEVPLPARKKAVADLTAAQERGEKTCLLATASLVGEGFDLPQLDTLFLAMPVAFKGRIVQYAGRLHRIHEGKEDVQVYDYVDSQCAVTLKMYHKRLRAYRSMGYSLEEPAGMIGASQPAVCPALPNPP
jgi:superfamily II DNA or RNA helicase